MQRQKEFEQEEQKAPSLLNRLETYFPGIGEVITRLPQSILSLRQFTSWYEAALVSASYVLASAVITFFLNFLLNMIATLALVVSMAALISSVVIKLSQSTQESEAQAQMLFEMGYKALAVSLVISLVPTCINLAVVFLSCFRAKNLIIEAMPDNLMTNIQTACTDAFEGSKARFADLSIWYVAQKAELSVTNEDAQPLLASTHN